MLSLSNLSISREWIEVAGEVEVGNVRLEKNLLCHHAKQRFT